MGHLGPTSRSASCPLAVLCAWCAGGPALSQLASAPALRCAGLTPLAVIVRLVLLPQTRLLACWLLRLSWSAPSLCKQTGSRRCTAATSALRLLCLAAAVAVRARSRLLLRPRIEPTLLVLVQCLDGEIYCGGVGPCQRPAFQTWQAQAMLQGYRGLISTQPAREQRTVSCKSQERKAGEGVSGQVASWLECPLAARKP